MFSFIPKICEMLLKTNPLIVFPEYDVLPRKGERLSPKKKAKEEIATNSNPFLAFPEYEPEACLVGSDERRKYFYEHNVDEKKLNKKRSLERKRPQSSPTNSVKETIFRNNSRVAGLPKNERKKKSNKIFKHRMDVKPLQLAWGVPKLPPRTLMNSTQPDSLSLEAAGGFDWNATSKDLARAVSNTLENNSDTEDSDEEIPVKRKKLTPAEKREKALKEEKKMKQKERDLLESEENPLSPDHFERLLIGNPNSAELWIKYMGYHAVNADIEKARVVARRGIKRIDPQLTSSKLDVWIAFLNLEYTFSPPDIFKETFSEALKCNDDYAINSRVLSLYTESKNVTEVDQLTNIMTKKYKTNLENWLQCQNALMTVGLVDKARNLLQKALSVLTKKEHVTLISRFALLENKHGFPEQAQALFENLLTSFPQRLDLLSVYLDMLIKSESINIARSVLERAASNSMPVRKMRSVYMKWIAFEEAHGKPSDVAKVEEAAKKYVSNILRPHKAEGNQLLHKQDNIGVKKEDIELSNFTHIKRENSDSSDDGDGVSDAESDESVD